LIVGVRGEFQFLWKSLRQINLSCNRSLIPSKPDQRSYFPDIHSIPHCPYEKLSE
jgi:hypothetical protein